MSENYSIKSVDTKVYEGQKPGTSGLRKRVKVFQQQGYTENFIQATLDAMPGGCKGSTLVVGGDGRYYGKEAVQKIIRLAAGNEVLKLIVGQNGILSTPAVSNLIRKRKANGGILLTASHNPGGPDADFGIKFNVSNGGPAPENVTDKIYKVTTEIKAYKEADIPELDLSKLGTTEFKSGFTVEIVDSVEDYVVLMKEIFDFNLIKSFFQARSDFKVLFDGMHGVTGPYGQRIFVQELGLPSDSIMNCVSKEDFGGGHPDPNLTYAHELVERVEGEKIKFGAASDGDGDRNMIVGCDAFVNPSDSVAVIAAYAHHIPYFQKNPIKGLARSMPTSTALDKVAAKKGLEIFEVPTGWKFFGNLMDASRLSICGEESFGTGSDHIREKDGLWAILAWLNILAAEYKAGNTEVSLKTLLDAHYATYGRNYFSRYDYEEVDSAAANAMIAELQAQVDNNLSGKQIGAFKVDKADNFSYVDPIDGSVSKNQGLRVLFQCGSRCIFRLSGTGSQGATIRLYVEKYQPDAAQASQEAPEALKPLIEAALELSKLQAHTGRDKPTVIT